MSPLMSPPINALSPCTCSPHVGGGQIPPCVIGLGKTLKLWQSCSDPHLKICPIAIFAFYSLNYSLAARLQNNSSPKSPTKVETKRKLQQFTVSGWMIINGGESGNEKQRKL